MQQQRLKWFEDSEKPPFFYAKEFDRERTWLRMNDFPEEPLWTLFHEGEELSFDDTPPDWGIVYLEDH